MPEFVVLDRVAEGFVAVEFQPCGINPGPMVRRSHRVNEPTALDDVPIFFMNLEREFPIGASATLLIAHTMKN